MSMSWKSYLITFFVIALVEQINTAPPDILDDVKIKSSTGLKYGLAAGNDPTPETTTTEDPTTTTTEGSTTTTTESSTTTTTEGSTTTTESPAPSNEFTQFTLQSTGSKQYKVKEATLEHGKWWLTTINQNAPEAAINALTFRNTPLVFGAVKRVGSTDGVKGTFKIKSMEGLVAMVVDFEVKGKEPPKITLSRGTSCYGGKSGEEPNIYSIKCD